MTTTVAVVFWNPDEPTAKAAITFHERAGPIDPATLMADPGAMCLESFFQKHGVTVGEAIAAFPNHIKFADFETPLPAGSPVPWELQEWFRAHLRSQWLPMNQEGVQKLAALIKMPVTAYTSYRHCDEKPREQWRAA